MKNVYLNLIEDANHKYFDVTTTQKTKTAMYGGTLYHYHGKGISPLDNGLCRKVGRIFKLILRAIVVAITCCRIKSQNKLLSHCWRECKTGKEIVKIYLKENLIQIDPEKKPQTGAKEPEQNPFSGEPVTPIFKDSSQINEQNRQKFKEFLVKYGENPDKSEEFLQYFNELNSENFENIISSLDWQQILILYTLFDKIHKPNGDENLLLKFRDSCVRQFEQSFGDPGDFRNERKLDTLTELKLNGIVHLAPEHDVLFHAIQRQFEFFSQNINHKSELFLHLLDILFSRSISNFSSAFFNKCIGVLFKFFNENKEKRINSSEQDFEHIKTIVQNVTLQSENFDQFSVELLHKFIVLLKMFKIEFSLFEKISDENIEGIIPRSQKTSWGSSYYSMFTTNLFDPDPIMNRMRIHIKDRLDPFFHAIHQIKNKERQQKVLSILITSLSQSDITVYFLWLNKNDLDNCRKFLADLIHATNDPSKQENKEKLEELLLCMNNMSKNGEGEAVEKLRGLGNTILESAADHLDQFIYILAECESKGYNFLPIGNCLKIMNEKNKLDQFIERTSMNILKNSIIYANRHQDNTSNKIDLSIFSEFRIVKTELQKQNKWDEIKDHLLTLYPGDPLLLN